MRHIIDYDSDWPMRFEQITGRLREFLDADCQMHHVGSTSVPGMPAKDIVDIVVQSPKGSMPLIIEVLAKAGYTHAGDRGLRGRETFRPDPGSDACRLPAHHLYACESGVYQLRKHLAFRDYLIARPERAKWLAGQKIAVDAAAENRDGYIKNKSECYSIITAESMEWALESFARVTVRSA